MDRPELWAVALAAVVHELIQPINSAELASELTPPRIDLMRRDLRRASQSLNVLRWLTWAWLDERGALQALVPQTITAALEMMPSPSLLAVSVPATLRVLAAPGVLETVLRNLLANVGRHAPEAKVIISARLLAPEESAWPPTAHIRLQGEKALLTVADNGPGVPKDVRPRLFLPLVRTESESVGFGIGLWLCRELVRAHGGDLWLDETAAGASLSSVWPIPHLPASSRRRRFNPKRIRRLSLVLRCDCGGMLQAAVARSFDFAPLAGIPAILEDVPCLRCTACGAETLRGEVIEPVFAKLTRDFLQQEHVLNPTTFEYLRKELRLNRQELALRLGVSEAEVSRWESSQTSIPLEAKQRLRALVLADQASRVP